uniref:Flavivirus envelope glycoprotein M n=1 Tax=Schistocephalus solidus TaxID=70667 RepID=A0A0V0J780_SCHSO
MKGKSDVKCAKIFRNPQLKNVSLAQLHLCTKRTEMQLSETTTQSHCAYIHVSSSPDEIFFELVWERTGRTRWHNAENKVTHVSLAEQWTNKRRRLSPKLAFCLHILAKSVVLRCHLEVVSHY